ncbi:MAG: tripartite tricarboxylate transporter substrate binding protein, partial [Xanthobacteraceae bacterium]
PPCRGRYYRACCAGIALLLSWATCALAGNYPQQQPVKIIVPFTAGGGVDVVARIITPPLAEELGQSVIIENRGGAGGALGAGAVAQGAPDGYTLLFGTGSTHGTNPNVYAKLSYDPVRDFVPVVLVSSSPLLLIASASVPATSVAELIALGRSRTGELRFASYGTGSINHLGAELFNAMANIQANHIPYRGSAPALTDLIGGRVDYMLDGVSTSLGYIEAGTVRALGAAGLRRTPILPALPTVAEAALPDFDCSVWFGLFAPAGTPQSVVALINSKVNAVLSSSRVRDNFAKLGIDAEGGSPDVLSARVAAEMRKWAGIVRAKNIHIEQ